MKDNNHISQELLESVECYYTNTMLTEDRMNFEVKLKEDSEFRSEVEEIRTLILGIENQSLKERLESFHEEIILKTIETETKNTRVHFMNWKRLLVAAALIIAAGSFWFLNGNSNERLYAKYFSPDPGLPTVMSSNSDFEFYDAMVNYKHGDYKIAINKWEALKLKRSKNDTLNYFLGVAYLANKDEKSAIGYLQNVTKNRDFSFINSAYYYLGMAYLKSGNVNLTKKYLNFSTVDKSKQILLELKD